MTQPTACAAARTQEHGISASPHIVIRGETSPRLNPASNSMQEVPQAAHIDWLAFTFTPPLKPHKPPFRGYCRNCSGCLVSRLFSVRNQARAGMATPTA